MPGSIIQPLTHSLTTLSSIACDLVRLLVLVSRSRRALAAENLITNRPLKCIGYSRKTRSRSARQSDLICARSNQGRQRLAQTRGKGEEGPVIDDVRAHFCRNGGLYGVECHAGDRCVRRKVQVSDIIHRKPFIYPVNRLLCGHIPLTALGDRG